MIYTIYRRQFLNTRFLEACPSADVHFMDKEENDCHLYLNSLPAGSLKIESMSQLSEAVPAMHSISSGQCLPVFIKSGSQFVVNYVYSFQLSDNIEMKDRIEKLIANGRLFFIPSLKIEYTLNNKTV